MRRWILLSAGTLAIAGAAGRVALARAPRKAVSAGATRASGFSERTERDEQIRVWHQALDADPTSAAALGQLAALHLQRAREGGSWDDYLTAERYARRSIAKRTNRNAKTAVTLVSALLAQHRFVEARDAAAALVRREPDIPQYRSLLGEVAMELGDYPTAGMMLDSLWSERAILSIAPRLARWSELNGRSGEARRLLETARDEALSRTDVPSETKAWFQFRVGDLALRTGRLRGAESAFRAGLVIEPDDPRLLSAMARLSAVSGKPAEAISWGDRAIATQLDPGTLGVVGDAYATLGDRAKAAEYFRTMEVAVTAQPGPFHRAWSLYLLDHNSRVDDVLQKARAELRQRRDIYGYDLVAWALHRAHRDREATSSMRSALRLRTPDAMLWFHDGMIARAVGDVSRARTSLQRALSLNAHFHASQPAEARAVLDSLAQGR
ncbi:MAG TPA: tetratricopeptide repeat protein [Gemmatimonadaceae bacterium]|nr:tetratricopeptide repeat protein [Gemmatimonadaceae bacterium]